jgi:hypothetical protein
MTLPHFFLLLLAAFRLTVLVVQDDFPPIAKFRNSDFVVFRPRLKEFLGCYTCVGFHMAWIVYLLFLSGQKWVIDILAIAGAGVILFALWKKIDK